MPSLKSRVFTNGNSQAVRIPAEFRLDTDQVEITRTDHGDLIIHPLTTSRGHAFLQALQGFDNDFLDAMQAELAEPSPMQDRTDL
jgi:antitoxin VapB